MDTKSVVEGQFSYKGTVDLKKFWEFSRGMLMDMGYNIYEKGIYKKMDMENNMTEAKYEWECTKNIDNYTQFKISIKPELTDFKTSDSSGKIKIKIGSEMILDYNNNWDKNGFLRGMRKTFEKVFYKNALGSNKKKLAAEANSVVSEMKAFYHLQKYF